MDRDVVARPQAQGLEMARQRDVCGKTERRQPQDRRQRLDEAADHRGMGHRLPPVDRIARHQVDVEIQEAEVVRLEAGAEARLDQRQHRPRILAR